MSLDDNVMFVSNIRAVFLNKLYPLRVLVPFHDTSVCRDTIIIPALIKICPSLPLLALVNVGMPEGRAKIGKRH